MHPGSQRLAKQSVSPGFNTQHYIKLGTVAAHTCNLSTGKWREGGQKLKVIFNYIVRLQLDRSEPGSDLPQRQGPLAYSSSGRGQFGDK